jgi:hypothetical protein
MSLCYHYVHYHIFNHICFWGVSFAFDLSTVGKSDLTLEFISLMFL